MRRVDGVTVACRCVVRRWICRLQCQVLQLCSQLSQGSAASSNDRWRSIIKYTRVSAGMVANALHFTGARACIARLSVILAPRPREAVSAKDPSEHRPQRHMQRPIAQAAPPPAGRLSHRSAIKQRQPLARPTPKAAPRDGLRITTNPLAIETGSRSARQPPTTAAPV